MTQLRQCHSVFIFILYPISLIYTMASVIISSGLSENDCCIEASGLHVHKRSDGKLDVYSEDRCAVENWFKGLDPTKVSAELICHKMKCKLIGGLSPYNSEESKGTLTPAAIGRSWFTAKEVASIYGFPAPDPAVNIVIGVVSFGGGLYGTVSAEGLLTNGDVQEYWERHCGIPPGSHPRVIIVCIDGATNSPGGADAGATAENTLDIETLGAACPSPNLTIILYIAPNSLPEFVSIFSYMLTTDVTVDGISYRPNIVSCSWGLPEVYYGNTVRANINASMSALTSAGISICTATGDNGSSDGVGPGNYVDFPSSSPHATAVGGTRLVCANNIYDGSTVETAWTSGGGGVSAVFSKPAYQSILGGSYRSIPDLAAIADPATGVLFRVNNGLYIYGGTSVAAPMVAGFLAAINCRIFVNPLLYTAATNCFHDITSGNNGGYFAGLAYDYCTGRGSVNGVNLAASIVARVSVSGVSLNQSTATLAAGSTLQITATVAPTNATIKTVSWTSSSASATVNGSGLVTGVSAGSATITATTTDGGYTATCVVTVTASVRVTGVTLNQSSTTLNPGSTFQLVATVAPANATTKSVTWSSNSLNATVSQGGLVTAVASGAATIVVTTVDGGKTASCVVTVSAVPTIQISPTSFTVSSGTTYNITATVSRPSLTASALTWTSSSAVATVPSTGTVRGGTGSTTTIRAVVRGVSNGTALITATGLGTTGSASATVITNVQSISLNSTNISLAATNTFQAVATVLPTTANNKSVTWTSTVPRVATVNGSGLITGVSNGTTVIRATTVDGGKFATITVRVATSVTGVTLNASTLSIARGGSQTLRASISPTNASNITVIWSSSNARIASISGSGLVRGVATGTATITVRTADGGYTATCVVTVR